MGRTIGCKDLFTPRRGVDTPPVESLRAARSEDLPALVEFDRRCFGPRAWSRGAWRQAVVDPEFVTLLAIDERELAGALVTLPRRPVASLASIAVAPHHRHRGLGRRLVRAALGLARAAGSRWLALEVDADNAAAVRLYRREGFGLWRRFREDGRGRLEMARRVGGRRG